jgi:phage gpG-like protein
MLDIKIQPGDFSAAIEHKAERIVAAVRGEMPAVVGNLLAYILDQKLSGQVLNQRTGNLKRSGFTEVTEGATDTTGYVGFGRTVPYAAIQNYGGTIPEVSGKLMVFERAGATVFTMRHRAFDLPARNFLESSAIEQEPVIREEFRVAVEEAVNG